MENRDSIIICMNCHSPIVNSKELPYCNAVCRRQFRKNSMESQRILYWAWKRQSDKLFDV